MRLLVFAWILFYALPLQASIWEADSVDIRLKQVPYPFPVQMMPAQICGAGPVEIAYMDAPAQTAEQGVVLLLHDYHFPAAYWEPTMRVLQQAGYRVIAPDALGFGKSSKPVIPYTYDLLAALTHNLLDTLRVKQVSVIGHGMGAVLAARMAVRYPCRVKRMVLENPPAMQAGSNPPADVQDLYRKGLLLSYEDMLHDYKQLFTPVWKETYRQWVDLAYALSVSNGYEQYMMVCALLQGMMRSQPANFTDINMPVLVATSRPHIQDSSRVWHMPAARQVSYTHAGGVLHLQQPNGFHADVLAFLKEPMLK
jgi:pimeloyl-ACP methyl ester carboxylesterase